MRKINQLPYHLTHAQELNLIKQEVVCNYEFLLAKIKSSGLRSVLADLKAAQMAFPKDHDISVILEALQVKLLSALGIGTEFGGHSKKYRYNNQ